MGLLRTLLGVMAAGGLVAGCAVLLGGSGGTSLGSLWHGLAPDSLNLTQAIIQRYLHPALWTHGALPLLLLPAAGAFFGLALLGALPWALLRWRTQRAQAANQP